MWVIDIRHWLNDDKTGPAVPQLRLKVKKMTEIITFATSLEKGLVTSSPPKCWRRPNRKPCAGELEIHFTAEDRIHWICPVCEDEGVLMGFRGLIWDISEGIGTAH